MSKQPTKTEPKVHPIKSFGIQKVDIGDARHLWQLVETKTLGDKVTAQKVLFGPDELGYVIEKFGLAFSNKVIRNGGGAFVDDAA